MAAAVALHKVPAGHDVPRSFNVVIETPKGSPVRYEYDPEIEAFRRVGRVLGGQTYPADYGFVPSTMSLDGQPLDVLVLSQDPSFPGCLVECRPVAVLQMTLRDLPDHKIVAVPLGVDQVDGIGDLDDLTAEEAERLGAFFEYHPTPEGENQTYVGWDGAEAARDVVFRAWEGFLV